MFSLFGCFGKKPATNIEGRLEELFPGRYQVRLANLKMLDVMAQFRGEKRAIVAEKQNPDIQFVLDWQKGSDGLGVDAAEVAKGHERAKAGHAEGTRLAALFRQQGLERFSVGVMQPSVIVQVFAEPTAAAREQALQRIKTALDAAQPAPASIYVEFMEPAAYQTKFQEIIPRGHWLVETAWQKEQKTVSLNFEWKAALRVQAMAEGWEVNPEAQRSSVYKDRAFAQAQAWAEKNLAKPVRWTPDKYSEEVPEGQGMTIRYGFPYFTGAAKEEDDPSGYVCVRYDTEKAAVSQIKKQKEF